MSAVPQRSRPAIGIGLSALLVVAIGTGALVLDRLATRDRMVAAQERLTLLMTLRSSTLRQYWSTVQTELRFWSLDPVVRDALAGMVSSGEREDSAYRSAHEAFHPVARRFTEYRGYYDLFLIGPEGDVLYTVEKEDDFGTNLIDGAWRETGLAEAFLAARDRPADGAVVFTDLASYAPSHDEPAIFAATAIRDPAGETLGILALQLPIERIREIMHFTAGMGESGETYLVGEDGLMRSDSRFSEESTVLRTAVDTEPVRRALAGQTGVDVVDDYRGVRVLSAYAPVVHHGQRWAVMAEIDEAEVLAPLRQRRWALLWMSAVVLALGLLSIRVLGRST